MFDAGFCVELVVLMNNFDDQLQSNNPVEVLVSNLPLGYDPAKIRNKLKRLSENCGGRVGIINDQTTTIRFSSMEFASR